MRRWVCIALAFSIFGSSVEAATRIKDITQVQGVRANQLVGYGLVVGLNGTGDSLRNSPFTEQSLQSMLDQMGVNVRGANSRTKNIA
ncbi:MAG TPA: flagellar basal body P-ring protein FlgI, partial [Kiritimatiellia bacterium]